MYARSFVCYPIVDPPLATPTSSGLMSSLSPPSMKDQDWTVHDSNQALFTCLSIPSLTRPALPTELILQILNHPTRWYCAINIVFPNSSTSSPIRLPASRGRLTLVSTPPLLDIPNIKRIVFSFTSKDQGWSSYPSDHGSYDNTWSWFEALLDPKADTAGALTLTDDPPRCFELQRNRHAGQVPETYEIEVEEGSELFTHLKEGWTLSLVARACCPGWENQVHDAAIKVWCVDHLVGTEND